MPYPDRFYPVVDSVAWVARLAALGVGTVQLRAKDLDDSEALQLVSDALAATKGTSTKVVVNDYWRAAIVAGAQASASRPGRSGGGRPQGDPRCGPDAWHFHP